MDHTWVDRQTDTAILNVIDVILRCFSLTSASVKCNDYANPPSFLCRWLTDLASVSLSKTLHPISTRGAALYVTVTSDFSTPEKIHSGDSSMTLIWIRFFNSWLFSYTLLTFFLSCFNSPQSHFLSTRHSIFISFLTFFNFAIEAQNL